MSVFSEQRMLAAALPVRFGDSPGAKWWLNNENLIGAVKSCENIICENTESGVQCEVEILKEEENRLVFRIKASDDDKFLVVKVFPLRCLRHRLKYHWMKYRNRRFAFGEAVSLLIAADRGLNVPKVYGYGQMYSPRGLINKSVLILENLGDHVAIGDMLEKNRDNQEKCVEILSRATPFLVRLYRAGCNHISVNSGCIMLSTGGSQADDFILDFEYAKFFDSPDLELLMFEAATLAKYCKNFITGETIDKWVAELLDAVAIRDRITRDSLTGRFHYHFNTQLSRKDRQKIGIP